MTFIHNIIKIEYNNLGYLPGYPYHLTSDEEMFAAFTRESEGFFNDYYPCPCEELREQYEILKDYIFTSIDSYLDGTIDELPSWIYSYMMMIPTTFESRFEDIAYLYKLSNINVEGPLAVFNSEIAEYCYYVSSEWLKKVPKSSANRPPTMFGEPHVFKSLRLKEIDMLN